MASPPSPPAPINTRRVPGRRRLHFDHPREILADAERVTAGEFSVLGNWSAGQIFMHLARFMDVSVDGFAEKAPWPLRFFARTFLKRRLLTKPMQPGFKLPKLFEKRFVAGATTTEAGLKALREAIARMEATAARYPSPILGPLTKDEWDQLHCRHAELHLSFIVPK